MIVIVTALCYWLSRIAKERFSPFVNLLIRAALIQGIILDLIVTIHFANYLIMGIIWPTMGFELLAPPLAMLFLIYELQCNFKSSRQKNNPMVSVGENVLLQFGLVIVLVVVEQDAGLGIDRDVNVGPTVVIKIVGDGRDGVTRAGFEDAGFFGDVGKGAVAIVAEKIVSVSGKSARAAHYGNPFPLAGGSVAGIGSGGWVELDVIADE